MVNSKFPTFWIARAPKFLYLMHPQFLLWRWGMHKELMELLDIQTSVRHWNTGLPQLLIPATPEGFSGCVSHYKYRSEIYTTARSKVISLLYVSTNYVSVTEIQHSDTSNISPPSVPSSSDLSLTFTIPTTWQRSQYDERLLSGRSVVQIVGGARDVSLLKHAQNLWGPPSILFSG